MNAEEFLAIKQLTRLNDDAEAIVRAAHEFLRLMRRRELKSASGKVEFELDWEKLEELEVSESSLPQ